MNKIDQLTKLKELLETGTINKSEYDMLKAEILNVTVNNPFSTTNESSEKIANSSKIKLNKEVSKILSKRNFIILILTIVILMIASISYFFVFSKINDNKEVFIEKTESEKSQNAKSNNNDILNKKINVFDTKDIQLTEIKINNKDIISKLKSKWKNKAPELLSENPRIIGKQAFKQDDKYFIIAVLGFENSEGCHACTGVNDIALLNYNNGALEIIQYAEGVAGGPYGTYEDVNGFQKFGKSNLCVILEGCGGHMGFEGCRLIFFGIFNDRISEIANFNSSLIERDQNDENYQLITNFTTEFKFIQNEELYYSLELKTFDSLTQRTNKKSLKFDNNLNSYREIGRGNQKSKSNTKSSVGIKENKKSKTKKPTPKKIGKIDIIRDDL